MDSWAGCVAVRVPGEATLCEWRDFPYGVAVGKAVMVGGMLVADAGGLVLLGMTVAVNGRGVNVSGSVGASVGVPKSGRYVTPGVTVGTFGTHNRSPTRIVLSALQLANFKASTLVR